MKTGKKNSLAEFECRTTRKKPKPGIKTVLVEPHKRSKPLPLPKKCKG